MPARADTATLHPRAHPEANLQRYIVAALRLALPPGGIVHHSEHDVRGDSGGARTRQPIT